MASDEDYHSDSESYYPDETESCNEKENTASPHDENHQSDEFTMASVQNNERKTQRKNPTMS